MDRSPPYRLMLLLLDLAAAVGSRDAREGVDVVADLHGGDRGCVCRACARVPNPDLLAVLDDARLAAPSASRLKLAPDDADRRRTAQTFDRPLLAGHLLAGLDVERVGEGREVEDLVAHLDECRPSGRRRVAGIVAPEPDESVD